MWTLSEKSKVSFHWIFEISYYVSIGTWDNSDQNSFTQGTELWQAELSWCSFSPLFIPPGLISFILQCNYWWGTFLLSEFIRFVTSLFLELLIWIVFWLSLLNLFHVISVSNLFIHPVHTYSRIWTGVSHLRAPHPASTAPSNWTYFYFHFNKLKSHLFPISFQKDFLHSFNFQLFLLLNIPKIFCLYFLVYYFPIIFNPTIHTEYNARKITCLKGIFGDNWKERINV